jgi:hypothetical protein
MVYLNVDLDQDITIRGPLTTLYGKFTRRRHERGARVSETPEPER